MIRKSAGRFSLATDAERVCAEIMLNQNLEPRAQQHHIGDESQQQPEAEHELDTPAKDVAIGPHGVNHPAILAPESHGFFFPKLRTRLRLADGKRRFPAKGPPASRRKPCSSSVHHRVDWSRSECPTPCFATMPN
ncbi:hypothetical protein BRAS3843_1070085 [Bradyrhizobium sp. STM 3843]|nr:hypothetical protein BRAS3843_1070085 [Bradyrhizobium sp. STM 3843]